MPDDVSTKWLAVELRPLLLVLLAAAAKLDDETPPDEVVDDGAPEDADDAEASTP